MDSDRQPRVRAVFDDVLSVSNDADRQARLDALTAGEPDVRAVVARLLAAHHAAGSFLEGGPGAARLDDPGPDVLGRRVGPYEVIREIGRGGMGTVFLGVRADDQYRKEVAIKVVRAAVDREQLVARFARERQILATLDHPGIARLVDAGTTATGLPYLVSEDLRLHLAGHPVAARTDAWTYRVGKFTRRHRGAVAAASLAAVSLVAGLGMALWQSQVAREERALADAQRIRAERRFADVRQLANAFLFKFHDAIATLPGSTPARKLVVTTALEYLDSLAAESAGDPTLQEELAAAYDKVGDVQGSPTGANLGDVAGALASYRKAEDIRKAVVARGPGDAAARERLGVSAVKIADALIGRGDLKAAVAQYQTVRAVREEALRLAPDRISIRAGLAEVTGRLCSTLVAVGDLRGALQNCTRNAELLRGLLKSDPGASTAGAWTLQLALNGIATGNAQRLSGDPKTAEGTLRDTVATLQALLEKGPGKTNADLERRLAVALAYRANALADLGDLRGASDSYGGAVERLSRLAALDPANTRFRTDFVYMLTKRGELLVKGGDVAGARQATSRALALQRESAMAPGAPPDVLNDYAWALVSCEPADLRQPAVALTFATRAVGADSEPNPIHLHTLAWARFRTGDARAAVADADRALRAMGPGPSTGFRQKVEADRATFLAAAR